MKHTLTLLVLLASAAVAAQGATIASYELQVFQAGVDPVTGNPFSVTTIPATAVTCNLAASTAPTTTLTNPRFVVWDDPTNAGKECRVDRSTYLLGLPVGMNYRAALVALAGTAPEQRSVRSGPSSPFTLAAVAPAAPSGLGFRP